MKKSKELFEALQISLIVLGFMLIGGLIVLADLNRQSTTQDCNNVPLWETLLNASYDEQDYDQRKTLQYITNKKMWEPTK